MLTPAPLWWLVVAQAIWGPMVLDKQNPQHTKQSWVCDWVSQGACCPARESWCQSSCSGEGACVCAQLSASCPPSSVMEFKTLFPEL